MCRPLRLLTDLHTINKVTRDHRWSPASKLPSLAIGMSLGSQSRTVINGYFIRRRAHLSWWSSFYVLCFHILIPSFLNEKKELFTVRVLDLFPVALIIVTNFRGWLIFMNHPIHTVYSKPKLRGNPEYWWPAHTWQSRCLPELCAVDRNSTACRLQA